MHHDEIKEVWDTDWKICILFKHLRSSWNFIFIASTSHWHISSHFMCQKRASHKDMSGILKHQQKQANKETTTRKPGFYKPDYKHPCKHTHTALWRQISSMKEDERKVINVIWDYLLSLTKIKYIKTSIDHCSMKPKCSLGSRLWD